MVLILNIKEMQENQEKKITDHNKTTFYNSKPDLSSLGLDYFNKKISDLQYEMIRLERRQARTEADLWRYIEELEKRVL